MIKRLMVLIGVLFTVAGCDLQPAPGLGQKEGYEGVLYMVGFLFLIYSLRPSAMASQPIEL